MFYSVGYNEEYWADCKKIGTIVRNWTYFPFSIVWIHFTHEAQYLLALSTTSPS